MTPAYSDDWLTLYGGDCREVLASLPSDSVDCVVTSPPYWGLRDYGTDGQLGLERTPEEYVANMVAVFREVRRVLKPSGTCWLNLGDSYASDQKGTGGGWAADPTNYAHKAQAYGARRLQHGLKPKDLVGIPWRVAFALQADGWYLRSDIIWSKPNAMPESVSDRPTKSHEYLFMLSKQARYYFDADAVREPVADSTIDRLTQANLANQRGSDRVPGKTNGPMKAVPPGHYKHSGDIRIGREAIANPNRVWSDPDALERMAGGRNIRSVWTIATRPYPGAHFAVFPPELPERCIKAGSSAKGVCPECGAPWERQTQTERVPHPHAPGKGGRQTLVTHQGRIQDKSMFRTGLVPVVKTIGWEPKCGHEGEPVPALILDPFGGSGTVGMVANRLSRRAILIDLNPEYLKQQMKRNAQTPLGLEVPA